jgi:hypothetical protein
MKKVGAVSSKDIPVNNAKFRDFVLACSSRYLSSSKKILWYLETLVLSARFFQFLKTEPWGQHAHLYVNRYQLWSRAMLPRIRQSATVFEFGVAGGAATKWWSRQNISIRDWHGFDTFTGLPQPWKRGGVDVMEANVFDQSGEVAPVPLIESNFEITWHVGLIAETLVFDLVSVPKDGQRVLFIDVDLYEPTKQVLEYFSQRLLSGDLIYFDEGFDPWNEGLALRETISHLPPFKAVAYTGSALLIEIV